MTLAKSTEAYLAQFGSGLCYSLGLFLVHEANVKYVAAEVQMMAAEGALQFEGSEKRPERVRAIIDGLTATRWFAQAACPVRMLVVPATLPEQLKRRVQAFRDKCSAWSVGSGSTSRDVTWALAEAKELLRQLDELHGVRTLKAISGLPRREPALRFVE